MYNYGLTTEPPRKKRKLETLAVVAGVEYAAVINGNGPTYINNVTSPAIKTGSVTTDGSNFGNLLLKGDNEIIIDGVLTTPPANGHLQIVPEGNIYARFFYMSEFNDSLNYFSPVLTKAKSTGSFNNTGSGTWLATGNGYNYDIQPGYLASQGDGFQVTIVGVTANNTNGKSVGLALDGVTCFTASLSASTANYFWLTSRFCRGTSPTEVFVSWMLCHNGSPTFSVGTATIPNSKNWDTSLITMQVTGTAGASNDVILKMFTATRF